MKRLVPVALVVAIGLFVLATSGGAHKTRNTARTAVPAAGGYGGGATVVPTAGKAAIQVRRTALGRILVDAQGRTLYLFEADKANVSNCSAACLSIWPAATSSAMPQARGGALATRIATIAAPGGKRQVTYSGHPLYRYVGDRKPGDTTGQGLNQFGAAWYVLTPAGAKIDNG
jgi:predicted lipoprotein with Yx(FWY)xxD motif